MSPVRKTEKKLVGFGKKGVIPVVDTSYRFDTFPFQGSTKRPDLRSILCDQRSNFIVPEISEKAVRNLFPP
jgi:hypothetical protein